MLLEVKQKVEQKGSLTEDYIFEDSVSALRRSGYARLDAEVRDLKQGTEAIEERARSELGMIKRDEVFYQILEKPSAQTLEKQATPSPASAVSGVPG